MFSLVREHLYEVRSNRSRETLSGERSRVELCQSSSVEVSLKEFEREGDFSKQQN